MNRYDDRARLVFHFAREEGSKLGHAMIGPEHLLLGLMREGGNASRVLADFGATLEGLRRQVEEMVGRGDGLPRNETAAITPRARRVMELAGSEARSLGSNVIATEHILLGIIREGDGVAYRILQQLTRDVDTVRWRILATADAADMSDSMKRPEQENWHWRLRDAEERIGRLERKIEALEAGSSNAKDTDELSGLGGPTNDSGLDMDISLIKERRRGLTCLLEACGVLLCDAKVSSKGVSQTHHPLSRRSQRAHHAWSAVR